MAETEHAPIETLEQSRAYFAEQAGMLDEFWSRFGEPPSFAGKRVLDLGCGHGAGSVQAAERGAAAVLGIDLDVDRVAFAERNLRERYPQLTSAIEFAARDIADVAAEQPGQFDIVISKDTFEHVADVEGLCRAVREVLAPGGQLWVGFSPLWASPRGDHGRTGLKLWWAHAILPRRVVLRSATRHRGYPVRTLADIGLNGLRSADFLAAFERAGLKIDWLAYNQSQKRSVRILHGARRFAPLERLATVGIYAKLSRA